MFKNDTNKYIQNRNRLTNLWLSGGKGRGRDRLGDCHVHIAIFKMDTNKDLLYSIGNSAQYFVIN